MNYLVTGENPQRRGNSHPNIVPYQNFKTCDVSMNLAIGNDAQYRKYCELTDCPEHTDHPDYFTNAQRVLNRTSLIPLVVEYMKKHTTDWWVDKLKALGVPCGRVNTIEQVFNHEQIKHRNLVKEVPDSNGKLIKTIGSPINLSETPLQYHSASPSLSQHGVEILSGELGYSDRKIQQLIKSGVVG